MRASDAECLSGCDSFQPQLYTKDTGKGWQHSAGSEGGTKDGQAPVKLTYGRGGDVPGLYVEYVGEGRHRTLADFEDHVDDISRC